MTLAKVILITAGSILAIYLIWQLVALPLLGWLIDRLTMNRNPKNRITLIDKDKNPKEWKKYLERMSKEYGLPESYFERPTLDEPSKN